MSGPLWLVRHGHTVVHGTGGVAGRTDVALSAAGREAVERLGRALAEHDGIAATPPRWHASPLERTRDTATLLRRAAGQGTGWGMEQATGRTGGRAAPAIAFDERLVELDFGDWEGSTWEAVHRDHGEALAAWGEDWVSCAPPGGESFARQAARCGEWFDETIGEGGSGREEGGAIVVTHGGSIRALACRLLGWPLESAMRLSVDPATVCRFERDARLPGGWRLASANVVRFD